MSVHKSVKMPDIPVDIQAYDNSDIAPIRRFPWLTPRHEILFVIGWLSLFTLMSIFVSNPFMSETSASASPDYAHVMFLHGLLIGMVGLMALLTCQILCLQSTHTHQWITGGVLAATILAAVGGIWDRSIPGSEVAMWTQIFGFFALDEILIVLLVGMVNEWKINAINTRTIPFYASFLAAGSMLVAAIMGHLAGWIMEFGVNAPPALGDFSKFAGFGSGSDFAAALVGSHSHEMAVAAMGLTVLLLSVQFGYRSLTGGTKIAARIGASMIGFGVIAMTLIYSIAAISQWQIPTYFVNGANGIAGDDIVTGVFVMGGGVILALAVAINAIIKHLRLPALYVSAWTWILSFSMVVIGGFAIEMHEAYFGAGDPAAKGAVNDAVFTWLHQDIGLFLLPAIVLALIAAQRLISGKIELISLITLAGVTITFIGGIVFVFLSPATYGAGYIVTTLGLLGIGAAIATTLWYGAAGSEKAR